MAPRDQEVRPQMQRAPRMSLWLDQQDAAWLGLRISWDWACESWRRAIPRTKLDQHWADEQYRRDNALRVWSNAHVD